MSNLFTNRIVGYTTKHASDLTANPANWRKHPQRQRDAVQASLRELGWIAAVVENVRTGFLVDGHERVWQALRDDDAEVPVLQVDLSEDEERLALATFDPITYMAETDAAALDALLQEVNTGEAALQEMLADLGAKAGLYPVDPMAEWQGMPEFEQEDVFGAIASIKVHFSTPADLAAFSEFVGQEVNAKTAFIWYPKREHENLKAYAVKDES